MDGKLDANMRAVRLVNPDVIDPNLASWTIEAKCERRSKSTICSHCGVSLGGKCDLHEKVLACHARAKVEITRCDLFVPVIGFRPPLEGFEGDFATCRIGAAWYDRVVVGRPVALMNEKSKFIFGFALVTGKFKGAFSEIAPNFAHLNHSQLALPKEGAVERLHDRMLKLYGPHIFHADKVVTVVQMRRDDDVRTDWN